MAANTTGPIWELVPSIFEPKTFTSADTTTKKTVATGATTGGAAGSRIDSIMVSTDDTAAVNLAFYLTIGGTDYYIGNVNVPIGSGYTTVARVDAITTLAPILGYLLVPNGAVLKCNCVATMTAAKTTTIVPMGGDY
jgi:hypothetical protein